MSRKLVEPLETAPLLKYCSYCSPHFCCREMTEEKGRGLPLQHFFLRNHRVKGPENMVRVRPKLGYTMIYPKVDLFDEICDQPVERGI